MNVGLFLAILPLLLCIGIVIHFDMSGKKQFMFSFS